MAEQDDPMKNLPVKVAGMHDLDRVHRALERVQPGRGPMIYGGGEEGGGGEFSLRDILYVLFRHKWKIACTTLLLIGLLLFYLASMPQQYQSEARVLIRGDRTGLSVDPTGEGNSFMKASRDVMGSSVRTEIGIITSKVLAEEVVSKLGAPSVLGWGSEPPKPAKKSWVDRLLEQRWMKATSGAVGRGVDSAMAALHLTAPKMTPEQEAIDAIGRGLEVAPTMQESYVLLVTYRAPTPETAQKVLNALLESYEKRHIEVHRAAVPPEFFEGKIKELKDQLIAKETELDAQKKQLNISDLATQKATLLKRIDTYETALNENDMQLTSLKAKVSGLEQLSGKRTGKGGGRRVTVRGANPVVDGLRQKLVEMKLKEADLASRFTDKNGELIDVRGQIKEMERMIAAETSKKSSDGDSVMGDTVDPGSQDLETQAVLAKIELDYRNARDGMLNKELKEAQSDLAKLMQNEKTLMQLDREVTLLDTEYKRYLTSMQTADISAMLDKSKISNVDIVQHASLAVEPVKTQRKLLALLGFGLFMSLVAGIGWAFGLDYCDHSIKTNEDVERHLGLPVLVAIPYNKRRHKALLQEGNL